MSSEEAGHQFSSGELVELDRNRGELPYLKQIELVKYKPSHFGLEKWTRMFVIPDYWMRRIYRDEVWIDTDIVREPKVEKLTKRQKRVLNNWLSFESPFNQPLETKTTRRSKLPDSNDLKDLLDKHSDEHMMTDCDRLSSAFNDDIDRVIDEGLIKSNPNLMRSRGRTRKQKIAIIRGHQIQSESEIVKRALAKMNNLPPDKEKEFQQLIKDKDFMQQLNEHVQKFLQVRGVIE